MATVRLVIVSREDLIGFKVRPLELLYIPNNRLQSNKTTITNIINNINNIIKAWYNIMVSET